MRGSNLLPRERPSVCGNCCVVHCAHETTSASQADFENVDDVEVAQVLLEVARVKWFDRPRDLDLPIFGEVQGRFCTCRNLTELGPCGFISRRGGGNLFGFGETR